MNPNPRILEFQRWYNTTKKPKVKLKEDGISGKFTDPQYNKYAKEFSTYRLTTSKPQTASLIPGLSATPLKTSAESPKVAPLPGNIGGTTKKSESKFSVADAVPYASNLINSFRKPVKPNPYPVEEVVAAPKIRLDAERNAVTTANRALDMEATRGLSENTAAAVRSFNRARSFAETNQINERETTANIGIDGQNAQLRVGINARNAERQARYQDNLVERNNAYQSQQSENIANAADKYILARNQKDLNELDQRKTAIWMDADPYGIKTRQQSRLERKDMGGKLKPGAKRTSWVSKRLPAESTHIAKAPVQTYNENVAAAGTSLENERRRILADPKYRRSTVHKPLSILN